MSTTVARRREQVMGNVRVISALITTSSASDTWVTGLKAVRAVTIAPGSNAVATTLSESAGTVTIASAGGVTAAFVTAWGY